LAVNKTKQKEHAKIKVRTFTWVISNLHAPLIKESTLEKTGSKNAGCKIKRSEVKFTCTQTPNISLGLARAHLSQHHIPN